MLVVVYRRRTIYRTRSDIGSRTVRKSAPLQEPASRRTDPHHAAPARVLSIQQAAVVGLFPNRKLGTRSPPSIHHLFVASVAHRKPFQQVQNQRVDYRVRHKILVFGIRSIYLNVAQPLTDLLAALSARSVKLEAA